MRVELLPHAFLLDRYQLIGEIASGGMATVYLARIAGVGGFQRLVAIKRLHPHLAKQAEFVEMFLDEARLAASIHHKNVVPILEIGTSEGGYYLVMEYIEGVTLARLLSQAAVRRESVPQPIVLRVMVDVLSGLHTAHELRDDDGQLLGLVHRDCTPQNLLIGLDGCARITDFGVARASFRINDTGDGAVKGKLAYIAPEQAQGAPLDRRADLFTLGIVFWEVLVGRRLFKAPTEAATLQRILVDPIKNPIEVAPSVHPALAAVCMKALARDPERRYQTAAEMADALEAAAREAAGERAIATERQVEAHMQSVYGADAKSQRDAVRVWLASTPSTIGEAPPSEPILLAPSSARVSLPSAGPSWPPAPLPSSESSWPAGKPVARAPMAGGEEDATQIYESTSTTGVIAARRSASPPLDADVMAEVRAMRPRYGFVRLAVAAAAVGVVAGIGLLLVAGQGSTGAEDASPRPVPASGATEEKAAQAAVGSEPAAQASEPAPRASVVVASQPRSTRAVPAALPSAAAPAPSATAAVAPQPSAVPAKPAPSGKRLDVDLTNPYR